MRRSWLKLGIPALLAVLMVGSVFAGVVAAQPGKERGRNKEIIQVNPSTYVIKDKVPDKKKFLSKIETKLDQKHGVSSGEVTSQGESSGTDIATKDVLGSYIEGKTYFHGIVESGIKATFTGDGYTKGYWWGSDPYNADRITLTSKVVVSGISVTISVPPSAGFSVSGNTATYSGSWDNVWWAAHYYDNLVAESYVALVDFDQYDSETFRFGNVDYTLYTHVDL